MERDQKFESSIVHPHIEAKKHDVPVLFVFHKLAEGDLFNRAGLEHPCYMIVILVWGYHSLYFTVIQCSMTIEKNQDHFPC